MKVEPKIRLSGHIDVPAERLRGVERALPEHIRLSRAEPGCESFEVTPGAGGRFAVVELFANRAAFDRHQVRTAASEWAAVTVGLKRSYNIAEVAP